MKKAYYLVSDIDGCVWGVGDTKVRAWNEAHKNAADYGMKPEFEKKTRECSKKLYDYVQENGWGELDT